MTIKKPPVFGVKLLYPDSKVPTRGSEYAAGYDLYVENVPLEKDSLNSDHDIQVLPGKTLKVGTGIAVELPKGTFGAIYARSGLGINHGIVPANCVGIIDEDYRGEIVVALHNHSDKPFVFKFGDRIAQLVIQPYIAADINVVDELSDTERGNGGFGSTGK